MSEQSPDRLPADKAIRPPFSSLDELLLHFAREAPHTTAILAPGSRNLTYRGLQARVREIIGGLRSLGVSRGDRVALVMGNGPECAIATIALAAGAVCVPLNPNFTATELYRYFVEAQVTALLTTADTHSASRGVAHELGLPVLEFLFRPGDKSASLRQISSAARPVAMETAAAGADDAFVLLTSGTTSRPKIVPLTQAGICRSAFAASRTLELTANDRLLGLLPLFHAHGLFSGLLAALTAGSSVVCTSSFDPDAVFDWIESFRPTWYTAVPPIHSAILMAAKRAKPNLRPCSLRVIRSASSPLPSDVLRGLESLFDVPVIETYGMTEAASQIAANSLAMRKPNSVGRSTGVDIAIIDLQGQPIADAGTPGEIVLRGPTVTRGYDNDASATASAFRDGWFRTGDLGLFDDDGYLFIRGRLKDIINRGGQKVSPAEVEESFLAHPDVAEIAAFALPHTKLGEVVAAAIVLRPGSKVDARELRDFGRVRLAHFKVPNVLRIVPEIPKGTGGKINRSELAARLGLAQPKPTAIAASVASGSFSDVERELIRLWSDLLEVPIDTDQDVFASGADSLTAMQMLSRLHDSFGVTLSFKDLLDAPTVASLAIRIRNSEKDSDASPPGVRDTFAVSQTGQLTFQQQRVQLLSRLDPAGYTYHVLEAVRLRGPLDDEVLGQSLAKLCRRQEVLRTTFSERLGQPLQTVVANGPLLERRDVRPIPRSGSATTAIIRRQARDMLAEAFDLETQPPFQARLLRFGGNDHALLVKFHHIITDGWSQRIFWRELEALYAAGLDRTSADLPKISLQYREFGSRQRVWLETQAAKAQRDYWRRKLDGLSELLLYTDRPRPEQPTGRGARLGLKLSTDLTARVKRFSLHHRATPFMTLLAAFKSLLHRHAGSDDIAVGSLIANRNGIDAERVMGMFANTIILRTDLSGDPTFAEVLERTRQTTLDAYRHQDLPIEEAFSGLQARSADRQALFRVMFLFQNGQPQAPVLAGLSSSAVAIDPATARADLLLELFENNGRYEGWLEYSTDLFDASTIARMATHLLNLLRAIVLGADVEISRIRLMSEQERRRVVLDWNRTRKDFGTPRSFYKRFANRARRTPNAIAVSQGATHVSYRELERRSAAMADCLSQEGIGPDAVVILLIGRSIDYALALVAVQMSGGAFLPLDKDIPEARLRQIVQHSGAPFVLVGPGAKRKLGLALSGVPSAKRPKVLTLESLFRARVRSVASPKQYSPARLAYVIYTSGSTGIPKGAMVEQSGMTNHLLSQARDFELSSSDVVAQTAPLSFVLSVWQFLTPLIVGARVHIVPSEAVQDPVRLAQMIDRAGITVLQVVPSLLRAILEAAFNDRVFHALSRLRIIACCGEALSPELLREWLRRFPHVPMIHAYGSTECSDDVASQRIVRASTSLVNVPIGRPIGNTSLYVLDAHREPVPVGVPGELYVGGIGVGRGYLNDPEQTKIRFMHNPFSNSLSTRLYKTGDGARWRSDGILEFLGRLDHQVKVRGHRIELSEIEHVLLEHPRVQSAIVLAKDYSGDTRLVAHIVPGTAGSPQTMELRDFLKKRLPTYMIPAGFALLDQLPLTNRGKVDRAKLAADAHPLRAEGSIAPRTETEKALVEIWQALLQVHNIGVFDNFFDLGGHSLLAGQTKARIESTLHVSVPIKTLFAATTIAALAAEIDLNRTRWAADTGSDIAHVEPKGPEPVSLAQEQALRIEQKLPGMPEFNLRFAYWLKGPLNLALLKHSLGQLVQRHDLLRTRFASKDGTFVSVAKPNSAVCVPLVVHEVTTQEVNGNARAMTLLRRKAELLAEQQAMTTFDVARPPLLYVHVFRISKTDHLLLLVVHHVIVDGWSVEVLIAELSESYTALCVGGDGSVYKLNLQFADFARWQRQWLTTAPAKSQIAYWNDRLQGAMPVFPAPPRGKHTMLASLRAEEAIELSKDLSARLTRLSRERGVTLFVSLLAGFQALILARCDREDVCIAVAGANRVRNGTAKMIGPLVNTLLVRTRLSGDLCFAQALELVKSAVVGAMDRQEVPFDALSSALSRANAENLAALHQVAFDLQSGFQRPPNLHNLTVRPIGNFHRDQPLLPLDLTWIKLTLRETASGIAGFCNYKRDLFKPNAVKRWMDDYKRILTNAAANPEAPLRELIGT